VGRRSRRSTLSITEIKDHPNSGAQVFSLVLVKNAVLDLAGFDQHLK
jgi:hypothetical protein